jgi:hypothetical protein
MQNANLRTCQPANRQASAVSNLTLRNLKLEIFDPEILHRFVQIAYRIHRCWMF